MISLLSSESLRKELENLKSSIPAELIQKREACGVLDVIRPNGSVNTVVFTYDEMK